MKKVFKVLIVFALIVSCTTDNNNTAELEVKLLKKVTSSDEQNSSSYEVYYEYDSEDRIKNIQRINNEGDLEKEYVYLYNNDVIKIEEYNFSELEGYTEEYQTAQNNIKRKDRYGKDRLDPNANPDIIVFLEYELIELNDCDRIIDVKYYSIENTFVGHDEVQYLDGNNSFLHKKFDINGNLFSKIEVTNSDKFSAYNYLSEIDCAFMSSIRIKSWDQFNILDYEESNTFQYNEFDYPIAQTTILLDGTIKEFNYQYY